MDSLENIQFDSMGHNHETKCSKCGARLYIHEDPLLGASIGCKTYEEVECRIVETWYIVPFLKVIL